MDDGIKKINKWLAIECSVCMLVKNTNMGKGERWEAGVEGGIDDKYSVHVGEEHQHGHGDPLNLPLKEIKEIELLDNDEIILGWLDDTTLKMKGVKREREPEYSDSGSFRMVTTNETKVEREIRV